jgi:uncharacterized SAM-binding protein YcdF (DUF218 family)
LEEQNSKTTEENAQFALELLSDQMKMRSTHKEEMKNWKIVVVSDTYHVLRCKLLFENYFGVGNVQILSSKCDLFNR